MTRMLKHLTLPIIAALLTACSTTPHNPDTVAHHDYEQALQLCRQHTRSVHQGDENTLAQEVTAFQLLAERSLQQRAVIIALSQQLQQKINDGQVLSGGEIAALNQGLAEHLAVREQLYQIAAAHECWLNERHGLATTLRHRGITLSLAATLMLYDSYMLALDTLAENARLRQLVNLSDSAYGIDEYAFNELTEAYLSMENYNRTLAGIEAFDSFKGSLRKSAVADDQLAYLYAIIEQSPNYRLFKGRKLEELAEKSMYFTTEAMEDSLRVLARESMHTLSMLFGNAVGVVEERKGKLYGNSAQLTEIEALLQPGDILLEKTPFRLTDSFIPGYWGHVAVWSGSPQQLQEMGIWEHPFVASYHRELLAGRRVAEALRSGVTLSRLEHFLNIDDLLILRPVNIDREQLAGYVTNTLSHIGKEYDFNFDVETSDRIVCSEIVFHAYPDFRWPVDSTLGRWTISPDNVAQMALQDGRMEIIALYQRGQKVESDLSSRLKKLLSSASK
ncbi:MAG: YiiX/YebB-like N1pC/P60 family cysteine hydrolase [Chromatiales bacterium]|nr:YiiX/YebB-like N1pC/P60 family cysteine hydrolase [Chromatiales bacterium]